MEEKLKLMLFNNGAMSELYKAGFIGTKPFLYRDIYLWVDAQVKARGLTQLQAIFEAEIFFSTSERTIRRALKSFE